METQDHRYVFGSFIGQPPQKLKPLAATRKGNMASQHQPTVDHIKADRLPKPATFLPNIHISKLRKKPRRKLSQSLKCHDDMQGHVDCKYCKSMPSTKKRRMIPSLMSSSMLAKLNGKAHQGVSWWEWSQREYQIKETKFDVGNDDAGHHAVLGGCGHGGTVTPPPGGEDCIEIVGNELSNPEQGIK